MGGQRMPAIGKIYGKIVEAGKKTPIDYCTVTLLAANKDSLITGGLTRSNGDFMLEKVPFGKFRLRVEFIGYKTLFKPVQVTQATVEQDLGNIAIELDVKSLKEVTIQAEKSNVVMSIDRRVYNVDKDISAKGGTALDVMKNVPGVSVDADGNVEMRNASPTIFVDGRPTTLTLEQIPADQIDRIEIITNPSAKYDASSSGGILNVVMKKNTLPGYNGIISLGVGYPSRQNASINLNVKEGRFNVGLMYSYNRVRNVANGYTNRTSLLNGEEKSYYLQTNENDAGRIMQHGRMSIDYIISNRSTITLSQGFMTGGFDNNDVQKFRNLDSTEDLQTYGDRKNTSDNTMRNFNTQLQFRKKFPREGQELTSDITYNWGSNENTSYFYTNNYNNLGQQISQSNTDVQRNNGSGNRNNVTFQLDFTKPITDTAKWEFGVRSNIRTERSMLNVFNEMSGNIIADTALSNDYQITDMVNAAYVTYSNMIKAIGVGYQAGMRFEQTRFKGDLLTKNQSFEYYYPNGAKNFYKTLFPSLYFSKKFGGVTSTVDGKTSTSPMHELQLNFTRKISRPNFMQTMPFIMFSDKLNYRMGNPNLAPEFTNNVEFNYNAIFLTSNFFSSVYMRTTENAITNYAYPLPSDTTNSILINTFINGNTEYRYGWENNYRISLFKRKMDVSVNANLFYTNISANVGNTTISNQGISWRVKGMASYKLPKNFTLQVNGNYEAPRIIPQGKMLSQYSMDVSINKELKKVWNITLSVNDVFNTRRFGTYYESDYMIQDVSRRREVRFIRLTVSYRFGEMDASLFKRKQQRRGGDEGGGMEMEF